MILPGEKPSKSKLSSFEAPFLAFILSFTFEDGIKIASALLQRSVEESLESAVAPPVERSLILQKVFPTKYSYSAI